MTLFGLTECVIDLWLELPEQRAYVSIVPCCCLASSKRLLGEVGSNFKRNKLCLLKCVLDCWQANGVYGVIQTDIIFGWQRQRPVTKPRSIAATQMSEQSRAIEKRRLSATGEVIVDVTGTTDDSPAKHTRNKVNQLTVPTKVLIVTQQNTSGNKKPNQTALPTKTIVIHPQPKPSTNQQQITSSGGAEQGIDSNLIIVRPSSTAVSTNTQANSITVTVADHDGRTVTGEALGYTNANQLSYVTDTSQGLGYSTPSMDQYLGNQTHHHLQPGSYTVYTGGESNAYSPYYQQQYQPSLHSPGVSAAGSYIISPGSGIGASQQPSPNSVDEDSAGHLSHTTRASPATIQWLLQNYETAEGVSLPRCTLYNHYLRHCAENKLDPVNAASFGKLIRSVFLGLRTRRLGTRGNSKYHYYGIRVKPDSPLNRVPDDSVPMALRQQPTNPSRRQKLAASRAEFNQSGTPAPTTNSGPGFTGNGASTVSSTNYNNNGGSDNSQFDSHKQYLGTGNVPDIAGPIQDNLEEAVQPLGLGIHQVIKFVHGYKQHCEDILDCISRLQFHDVDECWRNFWQPESDLSQEDEALKEDELASITTTGLSQTQLFSLCTVPQIQQYVQTMDFAFYQVLVDVLIPNVLKPIPSSLTQVIRNFAKGLENGLSLAMQGAPDVIQKIKLSSVKSLAQTLRRYTSLNHLAQAARAVLQHQGQITQMLQDLNRVDFHNVQEQASWVCQCDPMLVDQLEKNFKANLHKQKTLEQWAQWLEAVVDQVLAPYHDKTLSEMAVAGKQFLLKWSFYSSMVIRDLTLRSAASFGSFHLIRLLYDEYMFYLIEQRLAKSTDQSSISIMAQHTNLFGDVTGHFAGGTFHDAAPLLIEPVSFVNGHSDYARDTIASEHFDEPAEQRNNAKRPRLQ